ncbi:hypothetical protein [Bacillus thuringiensis]|uniref:hypothetical protein n=1 Tax=Bacillus thuringiensis TaxID=1428 RepID=UPI000BFC4884|nr:hypothetical protein [Bacillus thuringiensis]PGQ46729.1 hypothetical protein COA20_19980 [Bacillus thuringiensis]
MNHLNPFEDEYALKLIRYVQKQLVKNFGISEEEADYYIQDSSFIEMLQEDPDFVFHYNSQYWANNIAGEHNLMLAYAF